MRTLIALGFEVKLIAPAYVKRQKNDMADAEANCEAAQRPTMRFVAVNSKAKQALSAVFSTRGLLVGKRTQLINALCDQLSEYGVIARVGPHHVDRLIDEVADPASSVPAEVRSCLQLMIDTLRALQDRVELLDKEIAARAKKDEGARRLMTIPGVGPLIATAIQALAPTAESFSSGPRLRRLGRTSRMGERPLRRLMALSGARSMCLRQANEDRRPSSIMALCTLENMFFAPKVW